MNLARPLCMHLSVLCSSEWKEGEAELPQKMISAVTSRGEDPGSYAGVMRFICGGRRFRLERNFARHTRSVSLICEDDGGRTVSSNTEIWKCCWEGMTPELFDSTVSIGQLKAEPGQELADALVNYAANYYETGGGEYDLNAALKDLNEKKRTAAKTASGRGIPV